MCVELPVLDSQTILRDSGQAEDPMATHPAGNSRMPEGPRELEKHLGFVSLHAIAGRTLPEATNGC